MSKNSSTPSEKVEYDKEKLQNVRDKRHQVKPSAFATIFLLLAAVTICIAIIEMYQ